MEAWNDIRFFFCVSIKGEKQAGSLEADAVLCTIRSLRPCHPFGTDSCMKDVAAGVSSRRFNRRKIQGQLVSFVAKMAVYNDESEVTHVVE